ncbi:SDR family NAD(P)-dependent oxidoreductase [bacterium]|nr:SDR family NAD(P)-dependent oxidoreductase [bacterium]
MPSNIRLHEVIDVARSPAECFALVADFSTIADWDPGVAASSKISEGAVGLGSQFRVVVQSGIGPFKNRFPMDYRITAYEPDARVVLEGTSKQCDGIDTISFTPIAGGTRIDYTADLTLKTLGDGAVKLMGPLLERVGKRAVAGLKRALDSQPIAKPSPWRDLGDKLLLPGAARFTSWGSGRQAIADRLDGQTIVLTGPTSGLGLAAAHRLSQLGARLVLIGRNVNKLADTADALSRTTGNAPRAQLVADLSLVAETRAVLEQLADFGPIDALVNNAGALFNQRGETAEGIEQTLAVDLLSPFLLAEGLRPQLAASGRGRVVNVASGGMYLQGLSLGDLQWAARPYDGTKAYAQAKRGLVALTKLWAERWAGDGIAVHAMHPGWADTPGVADALPGFKRVMGKLLRNSDDGADTMVWLAANPQVQAHSGLFWLDRKPHTTEVVRNTAVNADKAAALRDALIALAGAVRPA